MELTRQEKHDLKLSIETIWRRIYGNAIGESFLSEYICEHLKTVMPEFYQDWNGGKYGRSINTDNM